MYSKQRLKPQPKRDRSVASNLRFTLGTCWYAVGSMCPGLSASQKIAACLITICFICDGLAQQAIRIKQTKRSILGTNEFEPMFYVTMATVWHWFDSSAAPKTQTSYLCFRAFFVGFSLSSLFLSFCSLSFSLSLRLPFGLSVVFGGCLLSSDLSKNCFDFLI